MTSGPDQPIWDGTGSAEPVWIGRLKPDVGSLDVWAVPDPANDTLDLELGVPGAPAGIRRVVAMFLPGGLARRNCREIVDAWYNSGIPLGDSEEADILRRTLCTRIANDDTGTMTAWRADRPLGPVWWRDEPLAEYVATIDGIWYACGSDDLDQLARFLDEIVS